MGLLSDQHIFPSDLLSGSFRMIFSGTEELLIEQHKGLYSYDTSLVRIRSSKGLISVEGKDLFIQYFGIQDLLIRGKIAGVHLEDCP